MVTLVCIFTLERQRTVARTKRATNSMAKIVSGIIIETPDNTIESATSPDFVNITTGNHIYLDIPGCSSSAPCRSYHPFVDLHDTTPALGRKRLKQVMELPQSSQTNFALLTQRGIGATHAHGNQDRTMLTQPFRPFSTSSSVDFILSLLDSHGSRGQHVAQAAMEQLPIVVAQELTKAHKAVPDPALLHRLVTTVMIQSFHRIHDHVVAGLSDNDDDGSSGTTLSVAMKLGDYLHIANVGDSQTFVVTYDDSSGVVKILYATRPDTPDLPDERQRILNQGGSLWLPPPSAHGVQLPPRVYMELTNPATNVTQNYVLGISRSIGDSAAHDTAGVIADPVVASLQLSSFLNDKTTQMFVVSSSKGLLDKLAAQSICDRLAASLYRTDTVSPLETVEGILLDANQAWQKSHSVDSNGVLKPYRNDMTLSVVKVET